MTKDKMIYNDDQTIGVDEQSLNKLMNILTPRMQKQLVDELHNNYHELSSTTTGWHWQTTTSMQTTTNDC